MKQITSLIRKIRKLALVALMTGCSAQAATQIGPANLTPNYYTNLTIPATVASGTTSNLVSQPMLVNPGYGIGLEVCSTNGTSATTLSNCTATINITVDGTNWQSATYASLTWTHSSAGTRFYTNFPASMFDGAKAVRVKSVVNNDTNNTATLGSIILSRARMNLDPIRK